MTENRRNRAIALAATVVVHALLILVMIFVVMKSEPVKPNLSSGVYVQIGNVMEAAGDAEAYASKEDVLQMEQVATDVEVRAQVVESPAQQELITQNIDPTVAIEQQKKREEEELRRRQEEEYKREQERRLAEQKAAEQRVKSQMSAFNTPSETGNRGTAAQGEGMQGSPTGNAAEGELQGVGGVGNTPLSISHSFGSRRATLPAPVQSGNAVGTVIVNVRVDRNGNVVGTPEINPHSYPDEALRRAALEAAKKAKFEKVSQVGDQHGTITYVFKL